MKYLALTVALLSSSALAREGDSCMASFYCSKGETCENHACHMVTIQEVLVQKGLGTTYSVGGLIY